MFCHCNLLVQGLGLTTLKKRLVLPRATGINLTAAPQSNGKESARPIHTSGSNGELSSISRKPFIISVAGALAASAAELLTFPLDVAKVNMQVSGGKGKDNIGIIDLLTSIVAVNGITGLWRGITPALVRQVFYQVLKVVLFEPLTALMVLITGAKGPSVSHMLIGGGLAGSLGAYLTTPFDRVKVRSQILDSKGGAVSSAKGLLEIYKTIRTLDFSHMATLYAGASVTCQRAFVMNGAELTSYSVVKRALIQYNSSWLRHNDTIDNVYTHLVSALCSGFIASAVSAPMDRAKTLIISSPDTYSGMLDCLSDVFVNQGLRGMYKGFFATWLRLAPFTVLFFLSFEYLKSLLFSALL